jgi:hypothetical protein
VPDQHDRAVDLEPGGDPLGDRRVGDRAAQVRGHGPGQVRGDRPPGQRSDERAVQEDEGHPAHPMRQPTKSCVNQMTPLLSRTTDSPILVKLLFSRFLR